MNVIATPDRYSGKLDVPLSAKMVRTWHKKMNTIVGGDGVPTTQNDVDVQVEAGWP